MIYLRYDLFLYGPRSLRSASQGDFQRSLEDLRSRGWGALKKREAVARMLATAWKGPLKAPKSV